MRAKTIKNSARVNKEMSIGELKIENKRLKDFVSRLEAEVSLWRSGQAVDRASWASASGSGPGVTSPNMVAPATPTNSSRSSTPINPLIDGLRDSSRPMTPTFALEKDEREEFLLRENELNDQIATRVSSLPLRPSASDLD